MTVQNIQSFVAGRWVDAGAQARDLKSAITGEVIGIAGGDLDVEAMLAHARTKGGPALRKMTFHQRAKMVKALALYLNERKSALYDISFATGATATDHMIDVDGGIGTMFVYASKGRVELPDDTILLDGEIERFGKGGTFVGQHVYTSLQGVAVHINAFNFPVWGMLEKLAPSLIAGVPSIVKPATATCQVTESCVRMMIESGLLPDGALQLVTGGLGDTLDRLAAQDVVSFTGSADTALKLRANSNILRNSVRFSAEQDSLNASILGPDVQVGSEEFDLFIKEVHREMTVKAGQKCTAVRRIITPEGLVQPVIEALSARLGKTTIGDPKVEGVRMGAVVSGDQREDVLAKAAVIATEAERVYGGQDALQVVGADAEAGAFVNPTLFHCADPDKAVKLHETEAFGPVSTIMPYRDLGHAIELANRGGGSLVASVITRDGAVAREVVQEAGAWHGRLYFNNAESMKDSTGHGSPMPHMVHGGPGRAGGGEELGGIRGVKHFMQRTAVQGSANLITAVGKRWVTGATEITKDAHPFTRKWGELELGETFNSPSRTITMDDIEHFAQFTGDTFYAHMDEDAAKRNPFFPDRVAHGYLLLSFAAGLFVEPNEGPVLANTGLENLSFQKPVTAGEAIKVRLTVKGKHPRNAEYAEVRWNVTITNQDDEQVAEYDLLTMVAH